ncbi:MAG TPA: hypothetical protein VIK89_06925 [Cytophagaceae bacterium]
MELKLNLDQIKTECPKAWADFNEYYQKGFSTKSSLTQVNFTEIPFEMQLGVFLRYFNENAVELDVCNSGYENWPSIITEAFKTYENVISHYS